MRFAHGIALVATISALLTASNAQEGRHKRLRLRKTLTEFSNLGTTTHSGVDNNKQRLTSASARGGSNTGQTDTIATVLSAVSTSNKKKKSTKKNTSPPAAASAADRPLPLKPVSGAKRAPPTSSNKLEAETIPDGAVGDALNWGQSTDMSNIQVFHPESIARVKELILLAKKQANPPNIRALGHSHSWSPILADPGDVVLVFDKMKAIEVDPKDPLLVKVQAGTEWGDLARWSEDPARGNYRFAYVPETTISGKFTIVGTMTTCSHGTSKLGPMHDWIERLRVINADGKEDIYDKTQNFREWSIAVSSFGMLGVIVEAWVRLDSFTNRVDFVSWKRPLSEVFPDDPTDTKALATLKQLYQEYDGHLFTWLPLNGASVVKNGKKQIPKSYTWDIEDDRVTLRLIKRTSEPVPKYIVDQDYEDVGMLNTDRGLYSYYSDDSLPTQQQRESIDKLNYFYSKPSNIVSKPVYASAFANTVSTNSLPASKQTNINETLPMTPVAAIHFQKFIEHTLGSTDISVVFKVDADFSNVLKMWSAARSLVEKYEAKDLAPVNSFIAMRFTKGSDVNLSPFKGKPDDVYAALEVSAARQTIDYSQLTSSKTGTTFVEDLLKAWTTILDPAKGELKVHLAKWNDMFLPGDHQYTDMILSYARQELVDLKDLADAKDPTGLFRNDYFRKLFSQL